MKTLVTLLICRNYILSNWMQVDSAHTVVSATPFKQNFINNWCQHKNICQTFTTIDSVGICLAQTFCCRETFYFQFKA